MPRPVEGTSPYSPGLDGIRAVAVLGVIAYHLNFGWASGGLLGVGVFFVLSGYLITDLLVAEFHRRGGIKLAQFWLRRARRLLPALFVMLFVVVAWATLLQRTQLPQLRSDLLPSVFYYSNWWFIYHHVSYFAQFGPPSPVGHLWSLAVEEQFYLFWPLILFGALRFIHSKKVMIAGILTLAAGSAIEMAVLYSPVTDPTRVYDGTDTRAFALLIGAALAFAWPRGRTFHPISAGARRLLEVVGVAAVAGIIVLYGRTTQFDPFVYRGGMVLLSVLTALVIAVCVHPGARLGRLLGVEPLRWVGERSYGIYLWMFPIIVYTTPQSSKPNYLRAVLQVAAIMVVSALSWRFIEEPVRHGALGRLWQRFLRNDWSGITLKPSGWAVSTGVVVGAVLFSVGLSGAVQAPKSAEQTVSHVFIHHDPTTTTTTAPPPPGSSTTPAPPPPSGQGVTAIGDSIMIDASPYLQQLLPGINIDAVVGQQLYQVLDQAQQLKAQGVIGDKLILELGTNGYYTPQQLTQLLQTLGPNFQKIVLINTRVPQPWQDPVNQVIAQVAHSYPNAVMLDWYDASAPYPQYFYADDIHLNPQGAQFFANLIVQALNTPSPTTTTTAPPTTTTTAPKGTTVGHKKTSSSAKATTTTASNRTRQS